MKIAAIAFGLALLVAGGAAVARDGPALADNDCSMPPFQLSDDIYYVGSCDETAFLIVTDAGLLLNDGGYARDAQMIEGNIESLGFAIKNIKILLNSHAHQDHAGGLAQLRRDTGARLLASRADAPVLESGERSDFANPEHELVFPPVKVDGILKDGQQLTLGHTTLTIHVTPGHTRGCTSWTMTTHVGGKPEQVLFVCSVSVMAGYRLVGKESYPGIARDYARSIATLQAQPCDIMLGPHGSFFDLTDKVQRLQYSAANPFIDPDGCKAYLQGAAIQFQRALASQQAAGKR